jgi:hypothetical protein
VLKAYFDESGIHDAAELCVVAGYYGGVGRWDDLQVAWRTILNQYGVKEFHAKRFFARDAFGNRVDEYRNWSDEKAIQYTNSLASLVRNSQKIRPISCCLVKEAWNKLSYGERKYITGGVYRAGKFRTSGAPSKAYFFPFQHCILNAAHHCGVGQKIHFIFDLNEQFEGYAKALYALLKAGDVSVKDRFGPLTFETSENAIPIQVADLLCYLVAKYCAAKMKNDPILPDSLLRKLIFNSVHEQNHVILDEKGLAELLERLPAKMKLEQKPIHGNQIKRT